MRDLKKGVYDLIISDSEEKNKNNKFEYNIEDIKINKSNKYEIAELMLSSINQKLKNNFQQIIDKDNDKDFQNLEIYFNKLMNLINDKKDSDLNENYEKRLIQISDNEKDFLKHNQIPSPLYKSKVFTKSKSQDLLNDFKKELITSDEVFLVAPFISRTYLNKFYDEFKILNLNNVKINILTTTYDGQANFTDIDYLNKLSKEFSNIKIYIENLQAPSSERLHKKVYIFKRYNGFSTLYIGSSNLTNVGMISGNEINIKISEYSLKDVFYQIFNNVKSDLNNPSIINSDEKEEFNELVNFLQEIKNINSNIKSFKNFVPNQLNNYEALVSKSKTIKLTPLQNKIVENVLYAKNELKEKNNLVVMATGTGKTVVAGFIYKELMNEMPKVLFLAHRKEIIDQARNTFRNILNNNSFGKLMYADNLDGDDANNLFSTIGTVYSRLETFSQDQFNLIFFDEAHHLAADTFEKIFNYFKCDKIGLTATPLRSDGIDVKKYFNNKYTYDFSIVEAMEQNILAPFDYFVLNDDTLDLNNVDLNEVNKIWKLVDKEKRNDLLLKNIYKYIDVNKDLRCVVFCLNKEHAKNVSEFLKSNNLNSAYLTSDFSDEERKKIIIDFKNGIYNFICVVDIFNEGVDVPEINSIIRLRPTSSNVLFKQQLGRGLRKLLDKRLQVLDFVPMYNKENMISATIGCLYKTDINIKEIENEKNIIDGSTIYFEKLAKEKVKKMLSNFSNSSSIKEILKKYAERYNFSVDYIFNFLNDYNKKISDIYKKNIWINPENFEYTGDEIKTLNYFINLNWKQLIEYFINIIEKDIYDNDIFNDIFRYSFDASDKIKLKLNETNTSKNSIDRIKNFKSVFNNLKNEILFILKYKIKFDLNLKYKNDINYLTANNNVIRIPKGITLTRTQLLALSESPTNSQSGVIKSLKNNSNNYINDLNLLIAKQSSIDTQFSYINNLDIINDKVLFNWSSPNNWSFNDKNFIHISKESEHVFPWFASKDFDKLNNDTYIYEFLGRAVYRSASGSKPIQFIFEII